MSASERQRRAGAGHEAGDVRAQPAKRQAANKQLVGGSQAARDVRGARIRDAFSASGAVFRSESTMLP